jgi:hypothetical protein
LEGPNNVVLGSGCFPLDISGVETCPISSDGYLEIPESKLLYI